MNAIILSGTSDIGLELIKSLIAKGYNVYSTYNNSQHDYQLLPKKKWLKLDIKDYASELFENWLTSVGKWDLFISCIGTLEPIGEFDQVEPSLWVEGVNNNSTYQIAALMTCLAYRNFDIMSSAIFFAGGGTNSATKSFSSYTIGKIALIKAVELIDHEIDNLKVSILGPGWLNTKIHYTNVKNLDDASKSSKRADCVLDKQRKVKPMHKIVNDVDRLIALPKDLVGGRNFSSVYDDFSESNLRKLWSISSDFYRLRRKLN